MSYNAEGPIHMYNEGAYIRVVNNATNTVVNYIKANLLIQRDSSLRFFLKNDSYINYYNYTDVADPVSTDVDDLIATLTSWNVGGEMVSIGNSNLPVTILNSNVPISLPTSIKDQFSRLKVSYPAVPVLHINSSYDKNFAQISELVANNGSSSFDASTATVVMNITTDSGSRVVRQSKLYTQHVHGSTSTAIVSGKLISDVTVTGVVSKIGVFDNYFDNDSGQMIGNGLFFQWDGGLSVVYRTISGGLAQDLAFPQAQWNMDKFNGTYPSGINWDITQIQNFVFEWNQSIPGSAKVGIMGHRNDTNEDCIIWCHQFFNSPKFSNPCLPVRWEILSPEGTASALSMNQGPATVYTTKQLQEPNVIKHFSLENTMVTLNSPTTKVLLSIRLRYACERAKLKPRSLQIANIAGGGFGYWSLVLNPLLTDPFWMDLNTETSYACYDQTAQNYMLGQVITSGYIYNASVQTINLEEHDITLMSTIEGYPDILSLVVTNVNGVLNVTASIDWYEQP